MSTCLAGAAADALLHQASKESQYTSQQFQRLLANNGITCSMQSPQFLGSSHENATERETITRSAIESFFSMLKTERTARKVYRTRDEARADVFDYMERFYNLRRRQ